MEQERFELQLIKETVGEEAYHRLVCELGGLQISFSRPRAATIIYYYKKGYGYAEIVKKTGRSEAYVRTVIKRWLADKKNLVM